VNDIAVLEAAHHVGDGVDLTDVGQKLVAQPLALRSTGHQTGDVDELHGGRYHLLRLDDLGQRKQPRIRHRHDADIGLDGAEGEVGRGNASLGQGIEKSRFSDVWKADDTAFDAHGVWSEI